MINLKIPFLVGGVAVLVITGVIKNLWVRQSLFSLSRNLSREEKWPVSLSNEEKPDEKAEFRLADFLYPKATIMVLGDNSLSLKSFEAVDEVTKWYKKRLESLNFNIRNFVQTNINGYINNQLIVVKGTQKVKIEISKEEPSLEVEILVTVDENN